MLLLLRLRFFISLCSIQNDTTAKHFWEEDVLLSLCIASYIVFLSKSFNLMGLYYLRCLFMDQVFGSKRLCFCLQR